MSGSPLIYQMSPQKLKDSSAYSLGRLSGEGRSWRRGGRCMEQELKAASTNPPHMVCRPTSLGAISPTHHPMLIVNVEQLGLEPQSHWSSQEEAMPAIPAQGSGTKFKFCTRNQAHPRKVPGPSPPSGFPCRVKETSICWLRHPQGNRGLHVSPYITHGTRHQDLRTEPLQDAAFCCIHQGLFCKAPPFSYRL